MIIYLQSSHCYLSSLMWSKNENEQVMWKSWQHLIALKKGHYDYLKVLKQLKQNSYNNYGIWKTLREM